MKLIKIVIVLLVCIFSKSSAQIINFPDPVFKAALLNYALPIDLNGNGEIEESEAKLVTDLRLWQSTPITNMTGIEYFINLELLSIEGNNVKILDVSQCTKLKHLSCRYVGLTYLNINNLKELEILLCDYNNLTSINLADNISLKRLWIDSNPLSEIDITKNILLEEFLCAINNITEIDLSNNNLLNTVDLSQTKLIKLDVSSIPSLKDLAIIKDPCLNQCCINSNQINFLYNWYYDNDIELNSSGDCNNCKDVSIKGDTLCETSPNKPKLVISKTLKCIEYKAFLKGVQVGSLVGNGRDMDLFIEKSNLGIGNNTIDIQYKSNDCKVLQHKSVNIQIEKSLEKNQFTIADDEICSDKPYASVLISGFSIGQNIRLSNQLYSIDTRVTKDEGAVFIRIPRDKLKSGVNSFIAEIASAHCGTLQLDNSVKILVTELPDDNLFVIGNNVCDVPESISSVTIAKSEPGVVYAANLTNIFLGLGVGNGDSLKIVLDKAQLQVPGSIINIVALKQGCNAVSLKNSASILRQPKPADSYQVSESKFCSTSKFVSDTIFNSSLSTTFSIWSGNAELKTDIEKLGSDLLVVIPTEKLKTGRNKLTVKARNEYCNNVVLNDSLIVTVIDSPKLNVGIDADTICSNSLSGRVVIHGGAANEVYTLRNKSQLLSRSLASAADETEIIFSPEQLLPGLNKLSVFVEKAICGTQKLTDSAYVYINDLKNTNHLKITGDTFCSNSQTAYIQISGTRKGEKFSLKNKSTVVATFQSIFGGLIKIPVEINKLSIGLNKLTATVSLPGCNTLQLKDTALVLINELPANNLNVSGDTVCSNSVATSIRINNVKPAENYLAYSGSVKLNSTSVRTGSNIDLTLPLGKNPGELNPGINTHQIVIKSSVPGCAETELLKKSTIIINSNPDSDIRVLSDTIVCLGNEAIISIPNPNKNVSYSLNEGTVLLQNKIGAGNELLFSVKPPSGGIHFYNLSAQIKGCKTIQLKTLPKVVVNNGPDLSINMFEITPVCAGDSAVIKLFNNDTISSFQIYERFNPVGISKRGKGELMFVLKGLFEGNHTFKTQVSVPGCGSSVLNDSSVITVNSSPKNGARVIGDTICSTGKEAIIKMADSEKNVSFNIFRDGKQVGDPVLGTGSFIEFPILRSFLKKGNNKISFTASVAGCKTVNITDSAYIVLNQEPDLDLDVISDTVCVNSEIANIQITAANPGVTYQGYLNNKLVGLPGTSNNGVVVLSIPVSNLSIDTNLISIGAGIKGCGLIYLLKKATIIVNRIPDTGLEIEGAILCENDSLASVNLKKTEKNVHYQLYSGNNKVGLPATGNGENQTILIPVTMLEKGVLNRLLVGINIKGCDLRFLKSTADVKVNFTPNISDSDIIGASVCKAQDAEVSITNVNRDYSYKLILNSTILPTVLPGISGMITTSVSALHLTRDVNIIGFSAFVDGCKITTSNKTDTIYRITNEGASITGEPLLCSYDSSKYVVSKIPGAKNYFWSVSNDGMLNDNEFRTIGLKVKETGVNLKVIPVGDKGQCEADSLVKTIRVEEKMSGNGIISSKDTLCVYLTDTIQLRGLKGVSSYAWNWPSDIVKEQISGNYFNENYKVLYFSEGIKTISVIPYSECARRFGDTVSRKMVVLENAIAEANEYPGQSSLREVHLNGSGSSLNSDQNSINRYNYYWYSSDKSSAVITNSFTLNGARVKPKNEQTTVYLKVTNHSGYCASLDSAVILSGIGLVIPNVFSPNGDGVHDKWEILNLTVRYPNAEMRVFNKWGGEVWTSSPGYTDQWDGTRNNLELPLATYYYILNLNNGEAAYTGSVTILK